MDEARFAALAAGHLAGTLAPDDEAALADLVERDPAAARALGELLLIDRLLPLTASGPLDADLVQRALPRGRDTSRVVRAVRRRPRPARAIPFLLAAAALALATLAALWAWPAPDAGWDVLAQRGAVARDAAGIEVGAGGEATLGRADGTRLVLAAGTRVEDLAVAADGARLRLVRGVLAAEVPPQAPGRPLRIATPRATATVVGTAFTLRVDAGSTLLAVAHGAVRLRAGGDEALVSGGGWGTAGSGGIATGATVRVAVAPTSGPGRSRLATGLALSEDFPGLEPAPAAERGLEHALAAATAVVETRLMAFRLPDPWPEPGAAPDPDWSGLDARLRFARAAGAEPLLTLAQAPWWMKGRLQADGSTRVLTRDDEWKAIAYQSRIRDDRIDDWLRLVRLAAAHVLAPPWRVRHFQVWDRLAGYDDPLSGGWDLGDEPGDPGTAAARHGYGHLFARTRAALREAAVAAGVDPDELRIGGPGIPVGEADALAAWLARPRGADFISVCGDAGGGGGPELLRRLRGIPAAAALPVWWLQWRAAAPDPAASDATAAAALAAWTAAGGGPVLPWCGGPGEAPLLPFWEGTPRRALPWLGTYARFHTAFAAGTPLREAAASDPAIAVLASDRATLLVNTAAAPRVVELAGTTHALAPHQILWLPPEAESQRSTP